MKFDTEFSSYFIVHFQEEDNSFRHSYLWGIVRIDFKERFDAGRRVLTSQIQEIKDDGLVYTMNSVYKINKNTGEEIILPDTFENYMLLLNGKSPLSILRLSKSIH